MAGAAGAERRRPVRRRRRAAERPAAATPRRAGARACRRAFLDAVRDASILHRDPQRFALLYRLLWRLRSEPGAARTIRSTPTACRRSDMAQAVRRDMHKMKAFVRFRERRATTRPRAAARRLVRARRTTSSRPTRRFFTRRFAQHALGDPDAGTQRALGRRAAALRPGGAPRRTRRRPMPARSCGSPTTRASSTRRGSSSRRCRRRCRGATGTTCRRPS